MSTTKLTNWDEYIDCRGTTPACQRSKNDQSLGASSGCVTRPTKPIDLPNLTGSRIQRGQPAAAPAVGVDAGEMSDIENLARFLRGVADHSLFSANVRGRNRIAERVPSPKWPALAGQRLLGMVAAVDEEMRVGFPIVAPGADEIDVLRGDTMVAARSAIGVERRLSAADEPIVRLTAIIEIIQHHLFVVAQERHQATALSEHQQLVDHAAAIGAAIDTIAEHNHRIVGIGLDLSEQREMLLGSRARRRWQSLAGAWLLEAGRPKENWMRKA